MKQIVVLEGVNGTNNREFIRQFRDDYNCLFINGLFENPTKLAAIKFLDPDYIYVNPTGYQSSQLKELCDYFDALEYIPKKIVLDSHKSLQTLRPIISKYVNKGSELYMWSQNQNFTELKIN